MPALTTRQLDLLNLLIEARGPLASAELADRLRLTRRQVRHDLKELEGWLAHRDKHLDITPGVGVRFACSYKDYESLARAFHEDLIYIPSAAERCQLLEIVLLHATDPLILQQICQWANVSRTTILRDLDQIEIRLAGHDLSLLRRPNFGIAVHGSEHQRRQAIAAVCWPEEGIPSTVLQLSHSGEVLFELQDKVGLLPLVDRVAEIFARWDINRVLAKVAWAEAQIGGRFTDDAVLYLALVLSIQTDRMQSGHYVSLSGQQMEWLRTLPIWSVARKLRNQLSWKQAAKYPEDEIGLLAMFLLAVPRNDRWPADFSIDGPIEQLVDQFMEAIQRAYQLPNLQQDKTLRDGLLVHLMPACLRHRFQLWVPAPPILSLPDEYTQEKELAEGFAVQIQTQHGVSLQEGESQNLAMLIRAAFIRERPKFVKDVIVVCPSGMATAQLLTARLRAHFPNLNRLRVVSLRNIRHQTNASTGLIITTVPLDEPPANIPIVQVHPLLLPEDIENITRWLT